MTFGGVGEDRAGGRADLLAGGGGGGIEPKPSLKAGLLSLIMSRSFLDGAEEDSCIGWGLIGAGSCRGFEKNVGEKLATP